MFSSQLEIEWYICHRLVIIINKVIKRLGSWVQLGLGFQFQKINFFSNLNNFINNNY